MPPTPPDRIASVREKLQGYPEGTVEAVLEFLETGATGALDRAVAHILQFHAPPRPDGFKPPLEEITGSARLMEDLKIDSLAFAEMSFLVEDVLGFQVPDGDLAALRTVDDFREFLRQAVPAR
jgi:acyl carrier protein